MNHPASVFIMDVSGSTQYQMANELSDYLYQLQEMISTWSSHQTPIQVVHRAGDELVLVSKGLATAYVIAFYIGRIWKYPNHPPYFGFSFDYTKESIADINIERWIHPLMKQARMANDILKNEENRRQFHFKLPGKDPVLEKLFNTSLSLQEELIHTQTYMQSFVFALYMILGKQNKISHYINRTQATVSTHMKNGKTEVIMESYHTLVDVLNTLDNSQANEATSVLEEKIKEHLSRDLQRFLPIERII